MGPRAALLGFALLARCGQAPPSSAPPPQAGPPPDAGGPAPSGAPVTPHPGMSPAYPVVAASACDGLGAAVAPAAVTLTPDGATRWVTRTTWGCGCPTGPVFTLAFVPRTSPLQVRLCLDAGKDRCERGCGMPIVWDLATPMREAGATSIELVP